MDNFNVPLSGMLLSMSNLSNETFDISKSICSGDNKFFHQIFDGDIKLSLEHKEENITSRIIVQNDGAYSFHPLLKVIDDTYGVIRCPFNDSLYLYKINQSNDLFIINVVDSVELSKHYLELFIQGCFDDILDRLANY